MPRAVVTDEIAAKAIALLIDVRDELDALERRALGLASLYRKDKQRVDETLKET